MLDGKIAQLLQVCQQLPPAVYEFQYLIDAPEIFIRLQGALERAFADSRKRPIIRTSIVTILLFLPLGSWLWLVIIQRDIGELILLMLRSYRSPAEKPAQLLPKPL